MPRKRTTRLKPTSKPAKGAVIAKDFSENEKEEQLAIFLRDYDLKVKTVIKDIEKKKRAMLTFIQTRFEEVISEMPSEIKNLTLKEFSEAGGTYDSVLAHCRKQKRLAQLDNELWKPVKGNAEYLECIDEEGAEPTKQSDLAKKTPSSKPKRQGKNSAMPPPTKKNTVLRQVTPSTRMRTRYGQTPLITPKFDPNLPLTPENIRDVKPGERLMSLAGSPVQVEKVNKKVIDVVDKKEIASGWTDIAGVELSPSTVGKMLQFVSNAIKETS